METNLSKKRQCVLHRMLTAFCLAMAFCSGLHAQLVQGKVYHIANLGNSGYSMAIAGTNRVNITATDNTDYAQLWYVTKNADNTYSLRNLISGKYLSSSNTTSGPWTLTDAIENNCKFNIASAGSGYTLRASNDSNSYGYMHYGANQGCVVCWDNSAAASAWSFNEVSISESELETNWNELTERAPSAAAVEGYQNILDKLFTDKLCTKLNSPYANMTVAQLKADSDFKALTIVLQEMVLKVKSGDWTENNEVSTKPEWSSDMSKRFRLQVIEPYSDPGQGAAIMRMNAHSNLNNPTGIYNNSKEPLYIMVEGTIADGASLYLEFWTGHGKPGNSARSGYELREGLNVVPIYNDNTASCLNYVVQTFDTEKAGKNACLRKISDYKDLKVHIEGGHVNGFYNKMGDELWGPGDTNDDWDYYAARANQTDLTILGKYITLQFPLQDDYTEGNKGMNYYLTNKNLVESVIDEWDNIMLQERLLMGICSEEEYEAANAKWNSPYSDCNEVFSFTGNDGDTYAHDYSDYYKIHGLSFGVGGTSYMYGTWDHCGYHYNTMSSIIPALPTNAGVHWGPGHEIGHQHQGPLTINGLTEVTNNLFSNVVLWYFGETTSRYNGDDGSLTNVLTQFNNEGTDFFSNNIWALTHMYYKLFLYYHVLGHNTKFYPRLYEMLRQNPMSSGYYQDGSTCLMHFYKLCCQASGDDLTEFFRAHGFFEVMSNRLVGDYSNSEYTLTQEQIDKAIAEVKALNYEENIAVLFINDATGETIKSHKGDNLEFYNESAVCAEVGSYSNFSASASDYTYSVSGNTVTMEGTGGAGFAILNEKGELIGFSDKKTFEITDECAALIASGKASIVVANGDNTLSTPTNIMSTDNTAAKYELLGRMLEETSAVLALSDDTDQTKPGYYKGSMTSALKTAYAAAKSVYENKETQSYSIAYQTLFNEHAQLLNASGSKVPLIAGSTYVLTSKKYPTLSMDLNSSNALVGASSDNTAEQQWVLEAGNEADTYYFKNKSTGNYLGTLAKSAQISATDSEKSNAKPYKAFDLGNGLWAFQCTEQPNNDSNNYSLHCDGSSRIVGWWHSASDNDGSWWYLTATSLDAAAASASRLKDLTEQTEELLSAVGEVKASSTTKITLDNSQYYCNALYTSGGSDNFTSYDVLFDNNTGTFLHTDYNAATAPTEDHYIRIDVGQGNEVKFFNINYTTRGSGNTCAPTKVAIEGSNDTNDWDLLKTITSGLPGSNNTAFTIENIGNGETYRYVRMRVYETNTGQKVNGHYFFVLSEMGLSELTLGEEAHTDYKTIASGLMTAAYEDLQSAKWTLSNAATQAEYDAAYAQLETSYNALLNAKNAIDKAAFDAKKAELKTLIDQTAELIGNCGEVNVSAEGKLTLQTSDESAEGFLYCNAPFLSDKNSTDYSPANEGYWVLDNDYKTFLHTEWSDKAPSEDHYLRVYTSNAGLTSFILNYSTRGAGGDVYPGNPTEIVVEGCDTKDGSYTTIATLTSSDESNPLPTGSALQHYVSAELGNGTAYKYLRFRVTMNQSNRTTNGHHWFYISEFGITSTATVYSAIVSSTSGMVTEDLLIAAYKENQSAQITHDKANSEAQLEQAFALLQAEYNALLAAYNNIDKSELSALISNTRELVNSCYSEEDGDKQFKYDKSVNVTEELVQAADMETNEAQSVCDNPLATSDEYYQALEELQTVYDRLATVLKYPELPVKLTFDTASPAIYKIRIKRSNTSVLAYDESSKMVAVADPFVDGRTAHAWYFMANSEKDGKVLILPYYGNNTTLVLASNSLSQGNSKVSAIAKDSDGYAQTWNVIANAKNADWYNITYVDGSDNTWYFSNHGGVTQKMGFYNDANDDGSLFCFDDVTDKMQYSEAYYKLYNYVKDVCVSTIEGGDGVGYYKESTTDIYNPAFNEAQALLTETNKSDDTYSNAYENLKGAYEALEINQPEEGKFYTIVSANATYSKDALIFATGSNALYFSKEKTAACPDAIWTISKEGSFTNLQTGCSISNAATYGAHYKLGNTAKKVNIQSVSYDGQVLLTPEGGHPIHAQEYNSVIVGWNNTNANEASAWRIVEVENPNAIAHELKIGQYEHAGLYLNYPTTLPDGVTAYIIDGSKGDENGEGGIVNLVALEGEVLPSKTAVIVQGAANTYKFNYTEDAATDNVSDNLLDGSAYVQYKKAEDGTKYYIFGQKNGEVGLYLAWLEYLDENGTQTDSEGNSVAGTDNGTHFRVSANKIYFAYSGDVTFANFKFGRPTDISEVELDEENTVIYDLQGRRVNQIDHTGLYIVNGKKMFIKK